jgi:hypothetical protein
MERSEIRDSPIRELSRIALRSIRATGKHAVLDFGSISPETADVSTTPSGAGSDGPRWRIEPRAKSLKNRVFSDADGIRFA